MYHGFSKRNGTLKMKQLAIDSSLISVKFMLSLIVLSLIVLSHRPHSHLHYNHHIHPLCPIHYSSFGMCTYWYTSIHLSHTHNAGHCTPSNIHTAWCPMSIRNGAAGCCRTVIGSSNPSGGTDFHPNWVGSRCSSIHSWTWRYTRSLCNSAASAVGGSLSSEICFFLVFMLHRSLNNLTLSLLRSGSHL